ncbi:MAG: hypothetical protein JNK00_08785 [Flavipsychrobacter sp.]|nr:hypothetical protein [Flavipsychrobacter sp.]
MIWTHIYDLVLKLLTITVTIIILSHTPAFENKGILIMGIALIIFFFSYHYFIRTFSTFLYCTLALKMKINLSQAKQLNDAFSPTLRLNWLPMRELKNLDNNVKLETAIRILEKWRERNKKSRQ